MPILRPAHARGTTDLGWLQSQHSFSFGGYQDRAHMGFGPLRVINDDKVAAGQGFGTHPHRDMEIISYVVSGALAHKDSLGNGSSINPGEIQMMRAGTGITHSEYNHAKDSQTHFLQIWIIPEENGLEPGYQQILRPGDEYPNDLRLLASPDGHDGSLQVAQDVSIHGLKRTETGTNELLFGDERSVWIQMVEGEIEADGVTARTGDGLAWNSTKAITITSNGGADMLIFDFAPQK